MDFLSKFHQDLITDLNNLLEMECLFGCKVINTKYFYTVKDFFDGHIKHFDLSDCLKAFESEKINRIENNNFKIVL